LDLKALQQQFREVQQRGPSMKLSEHSCVEVIQQLVKMGLLKVFFTADGKEFLTPERLEKEILDELDSLYGRAHLSVISAAIGVDPALVEETVAALISRDPTLALEGGELLQGYLPPLLSSHCPEVSPDLTSSSSSSSLLPPPP